jgi:putative transposase
MENQRLFSNLSSLSKLKTKGHKVGRLRFKGKNWFKTFTYNQSGFSLEQKGKKGILWLSKIGVIPIKLHRQVEGQIKNITIKKSIGKWYCSIVTDAIIKTKCGTGEIGIDVGINNYIYDSNGNVYANPKHFEKYQHDLKVAQQNLSRKKKGSNSRKKARIKFAKIHEKIANSRNDFIHKLSRKLVNENKFIAMEKLNIKNLIHISHNAKNIADASWGKLFLYSHYKAENAGCVIGDVDPAYTTRDCNFCGHRNRKLELWQRKFCCEKCGKELDRDYNSALNILARGKELASMEKTSYTKLPVLQDVSMKSEAITSTVKC